MRLAMSRSRGLALSRYRFCSSWETTRMKPGPSSRNFTPFTGLRVRYPWRMAKLSTYRRAAISRFVEPERAGVGEAPIGKARPRLRNAGQRLSLLRRPQEVAGDL